MKKTLIFAALLIFSISAFADIRLPEPKPTPKPTAAKKEKEANMFITITPDVAQPTLVIKKSSAKMLRAALDEIEAGDENTASIDGGPGSSNTQAIIGGIFLSLAFVFGGVWFFRSKPSKTSAALMLIAALGITTTLVFANIAPPKRYGISKGIFADEFQRFADARGKVKIKIAENTGSDDLQLLIPRAVSESEEE